MMRRPIVTHRPDVDAFTKRFIQVMNSMTKTKPNGQSSPPDTSIMVNAIFMNPLESSEESEFALSKIK